MQQQNESLGGDGLRAALEAKRVAEDKYVVAKAEAAAAREAANISAKEATEAHDAAEIALKDLERKTKKEMLDAMDRIFVKEHVGA